MRYWKSARLLVIGATFIVCLMLSCYVAIGLFSVAMLQRDDVDAHAIVGSLQVILNYAAPLAFLLCIVLLVDRKRATKLEWILVSFLMTCSIVALLILKWFLEDPLAGFWSIGDYVWWWSKN